MTTHDILKKMEQFKIDPTKMDVSVDS